MNERLPRRTPRTSDSASAFHRLRDALVQADITLPSLALDPAIFGGGQLVELGRVNAETAEALAAVIERGSVA